MYFYNKVKPDVGERSSIILGRFSASLPASLNHLPSSITQRWVIQSFVSLLPKITRFVLVPYTRQDAIEIER